jgi:uncharacterized membrane protein YphA (DoxX/SURF4 family)
MGYLEFGARMLLAVLFGLAVGGKLRSSGAFRAFAHSLREGLGTPPGLTTPIAAAVVIGEALVTALLVLPASARLGSWAAAAVLAGFTAVTAWLVHRRTTASCHCFGATGTRFGPRHVIRNAVLTAIAMLAAALGPSPGIHPAGAAVTAAAGGVLALLVTRWDDLVALAAPIAVNTDHPSR